MRILIDNRSDLSFFQIGRLIDDINSRIETNYVGKWNSYDMKINAKVYHIETLIQKTQFKVLVMEKDYENRR